MRKKSSAGVCVNIELRPLRLGEILDRTLTLSSGWGDSERNTPRPRDMV
jgi:hypothetical protein